MLSYALHEESYLCMQLDIACRANRLKSTNRLIAFTLWKSPPTPAICTAHKTGPITKLSSHQRLLTSDNIRQSQCKHSDGIWRKIQVKHQSSWLSSSVEHSFIINKPNRNCEIKLTVRNGRLSYPSMTAATTYFGHTETASILFPPP
jgi:hypothetical protein